MGAITDLLDICDQVGHLATELGIGLLHAEDTQLDGRSVRIGSRSLLNFTSCSYLGLELDARLQEGAIDATRRFGTQFSVSRAFLSAPPYEALEERLGELTGGAVLVTPNTTLASAAALPSLVGEKDAVLLDHQVHMTVQLVMPLLQRMGVPVELVRHGRLDRLEERIEALAPQHERVWFCLDGVYSMHGDLAPIEALGLLLARHEQLHLYVDDAHGASWTGRHGRGHALTHLAERERAVVALSLNKSFAAAGGALVLPDEPTRRRVRHTAAPLLFTGPVQPPMLGAALASVAIHLSPEIGELQGELRERIRHANARSAELRLPLLHANEIVPIRFLALGPQPASASMAARLIERGLLTSCALFPAVPAHQTGIRFSLTRHHRLEDIDRLLETVADLLPRQAAAPRPVPTPLTLQHATSIEALDAHEWDHLLGARGTFDAEGLRTLESIFGPHQKPENHWRFHYYVVRQPGGAPLLATFFTEACMKDDLFADPATSREVERRRHTDPWYLTSRAVTMGSPLTEGDHLHLDRRGAWREALALVVSHVSHVADDAEASLLALRDLPADDPELDAALRELGFARTRAPESFVVDVDWSSHEEFLARLSKRSRRFQRREVEPFDDHYEVKILRAGDPLPPPDWWSHLYGLYLNVQQRNLQLNTFALPEDLLPKLMQHAGWEIVTLTLRPEHAGGHAPLPHAFFAARVERDLYAPILVGLDDPTVREHAAYPSDRPHRPYRQCLAWMVRCAEARGARRILLGVGAPVEKRRFGARAVARNLWIQSRDSYHAELLAVLAGEVELLRDD